MRFAITLTDRYLNVLHAFLGRGWTPVKIFTTPVDQRIHHNQEVLEFARKLKVDVQISRMSQDNLKELGDRGCEALIVASYGWRIGDWRAHLKYAVNFHPSPLPHGRGPYPAPVPILEHSPTWGVSCHKIDAQFDRGDVLHTIAFPMSDDDEHDSVDLKIQMANQQLAAHVAERFVELWNAATPQAGGSYYGRWTQKERSLDFTQTVAQVLHRVRAFGPLECLARVNDLTVFIRRAVGWTQPHGLTAGLVTYTNGGSIVVAVADGYVALTQWSLLTPEQRAQVR